MREFEVRVYGNGLGSHLCSIPKPVMEMMGNPSKVKFLIRGKGIVFSPSGKHGE